MRNRVTIKERIFRVNSEKKTVVCIIKCAINWPEEVETTYSSKFYDYVIDITGAKGWLSDFTVVGISKCHADDTFDEVLGRRIAESRAKKEAYEKAMMVWRKIGIHYLRLSGLSRRINGACCRARNIEKEHINKLIG